MNGSGASVAWDQETPQQLWVGHRAQPNQLLSDDPGLMNADVAHSAHFPGGHIEGWPDAFRNMMLQFYTAVREGRPPAKNHSPFATFYEGARVMSVVDAILQSHRQQRWIKV